MLTYNPSLFEYGVNAALIKSRTMAEPSLVGRIAEKIPSGSYHNLYPFIGETPQMQALVDELVVQGMSDASYELVNGVHKVGIEVKRTDMHDDQLGAIMNRVLRLATIAQNYANKLLTTAIINATTATGYDATAWFSASHPARGQQTATQSNLLTGTGVTVPALKTDLQSALAAAQNYKGENNEPWAGSRNSFLMMVPPAILVSAEEAAHSALVPAVFGSNTAAAAYSNGLSSAGFQITVVGNPRLTDVNDWYLFDTEGDLPMIYQEAEGLSIEILAAGSPDWIKRDVAMFVARWRGVCGYKSPAQAFKTTNT